jgi:hypothetical protein
MYCLEVMADNRGIAIRGKHGARTSGRVSAVMTGRCNDSTKLVEIRTGQTTDVSAMHYITIAYTYYALMSFCITVGASLCTCSV